MRQEYETRLGADQLAALAAVIEFGSFDAAAEQLHVTPSAVSQRIKALEQRVGQVLVVREKPCRATTAGAPLLRLAAQTAMLESEALAETGGGSAERTRIAIAVNADSMSTWFTAVLGRLPDVLFDIRIEDQDHSARLLREGAVMGAVTTERMPVPGCRVQSLGVMRYVPVAAPGYVERYLSDGFIAEAVALHRRWRGIVTMHYRTCWCAELSVAGSPAPFTMCLPPKASERRCETDLDGACTQSGWQRRCWPTARSSGSRMRILMCRCSGSAGSWTARWSRPSPTQYGQQPQVCAGAGRAI